jgi:hypothetical protein
MSRQSIYTDELRDRFLEEHGTEFTPNDVRQFIAENLPIDYKPAITAYQKRIAQSFIASFKDRHGVRLIFSVGGDEKRYAITDRTRDLRVLEAQKTQLEKKRDGYGKSIQKVEKRIFNVKYQVTMFDDYAEKGAVSYDQTDSIHGIG